MTSSLCLRGEIRLLNSMVSLSQTINDLIYWDDDQDYHIYMLKQEIFKYQALLWLSYKKKIQKK